MESNKSELSLPHPAVIHVSNNLPPAGSSGITKDGGSNVIDSDFDYQKEDLNKLSAEELDKHKKKMDVVFNQNKIEADNPEFKYDIQEEFNPVEDNDWDEEL